MKIKNTEVLIIQGDITKIDAEAIVNPSRTDLAMAEGVALAIKSAGGPEIEGEAQQSSPLNIGKAVATKAGRLPARYVIHAAVMGNGITPDEAGIRNASRNALLCAGELKAASIAFPAMGSGNDGFPSIASAKIIAQEVYRHIVECESGIRKIIFCLGDKAVYDIYAKHAFGYLEYIAFKLRSPFLTVDAIIEVADGVVVIKRSNPPFGWALPGGFVDYGESLEEAVVREAKEETGLDLYDVRQLHTYSQPGRDPRFHTVSTVFSAKAQGEPKAGDDAAGIKVVRKDEIPRLDFAFDHRDILREYLEKSS